MKRDTPVESRPASNLKRAWMWLAFIPAGLLLGQLIGHLTTWVFDRSEEGPFTGPLWQKLLIAVPATVLMVVPGLVSAFYGRRLTKAGNRSGYIHIYIGGILSAVMLMVSVLTSFGVGQ